MNPPDTAEYLKEHDLQSHLFSTQMWFQNSFNIVEQFDPDEPAMQIAYHRKFGVTAVFYLPKWFFYQKVEKYTSEDRQLYEDIFLSFFKTEGLVFRDILLTQCVSPIPSRKLRKFYHFYFEAGQIEAQKMIHLIIWLRAPWFLEPMMNKYKSSGEEKQERLLKKVRSRIEELGDDDSDMVALQRWLIETMVESEVFNKKILAWVWDEEKQEARAIENWDDYKKGITKEVERTF